MSKITKCNPSIVIESPNHFDVMPFFDKVRIPQPQKLRLKRI